jgi:hemolysin activation/secretion protein
MPTISNATSRLRHPVASPLLMALIGFAVVQPTLATAQAALDSGAILNQTQAPAEPPSAAKSPSLLAAPPVDRQQPGGRSFPVKRIEIMGVAAADAATLHALVADGEGQNLSLAQLNALALRITAYYRGQGYPLVSAIVPPQAVSGGVVQMRVLMARYGKVTLTNRSQVGDGLLQATLAPVTGGQEITQLKLDRTLLLLSDVPGIAVTATLTAGEKAGTSDLLVSASALPRVSGSAAVDNFGSTYTGHARVGVKVNVIDPLNLRTSDSLTLDALTSNKKLRFARLAYDRVLNGQGTRFGGAYSNLTYSLDTPLEASGSAKTASLWLKQPLIRSRESNLYGMLQYDGVQLRDHIDAQAIKIDRHLESWTLGVFGDWRDDLLSGASNNWALRWTQGKVGFDDADAQAANAATVNTQGNYSKWVASVSRSQRLGASTSVYVAASGQRASSNLDSSQKMTVGGPYGVRAYDAGVVSADSGELVSLELRQALGRPWDGQLTGLAFVDSARVTVNKNLWTGTTGPNTARFSGVGLGLQWSGPQDWMAKAHVAVPVGTIPVLTDSDRSPRVWFQAQKGF